MALAMRVFPHPGGRRGARPWARRSRGAQKPLDTGAAVRYHPDPLELGFQTADVFIGQGSAAPFFTLGLADDQDGGRG